MIEQGPEELLLGLTVVLVLGTLAQWLAWQLRLPSILLLLLFGFAAGPGLGLVNPDELLGPLLLPMVSISVSVILFDGGLSLKLSELRDVGGVVVRLTTIGVVLALVLTAAAAHWIMGLEVAPALLVGSILIVTGPTVIIPLLRQVRPNGRVASALKWEGILNDPVGAIGAVLVYEALLVGGVEGHAGMKVVESLGLTLLGGVGMGLAGALAAVLLLRRYWVPDHLENPMVLMLVVGSFAAANAIQEEAGLLAVTVMGVVLANQKWARVEQVVAFKQSLGTLLVSVVFVVLAARLRVDDLRMLGWSGAAFVGVLIVVIRPATIFGSLAGSSLTWSERSFVAGMAPRGIVAAAVASVFALRLEQAGHAQAPLLVPLIFAVIIATIAVYGLSARPLTRLLKIGASGGGVLIVGANALGRAIGQVLKEAGFPVMLVDMNRAAVRTAQLEGLPARQGNILSEQTVERLELEELGMLLAVTSNDEANGLAAQRLSHDLSRRNVFQLSPGDASASNLLQGRPLFGEEMTCEVLLDRLQSGWTVKATPLTEQFTYAQFREHHNDACIALFVIGRDRVLRPIRADEEAAPKAGQTVISLVADRQEKAEGRQPDAGGEQGA